jgi:putative acetyltransferase
VEIAIDDPTGSHVRQLLLDHLADMHATSPAESVHALDSEALRDPSVTFFTASERGSVLGCGALKELTAREGEIKSMRTTADARGRGVASALLERILAEARGRGYTTLSLETGPQDFFAPARRLYQRYGFVECGPFADYTLDPHSIFMTLDLAMRSDRRMHA